MPAILLGLWGLLLAALCHRTRSIVVQPGVLQHQACSIAPTLHSNDGHLHMLCNSNCSTAALSAAVLASKW
jgi:predicted neuraminidase